MFTDYVKISDGCKPLSYRKITNCNSSIGMIGYNGNRFYSSVDNGKKVLVPSAFIAWYDGRNDILLTDKTAIMNMKRLDEIKQLLPDWNGYGACSFSSQLIEICEKIVELLEIQPQIFPTGRNSIQLQYELSDRNFYCVSAQ